MYKGVIYKCKCLKTNKIYIGQTIQKFEERKRCHIKDSYDEKCPGYNYHFHRAIRKYGIESFEWKILSKIEESSMDLLQKILDEQEIYYINKYNSFYNGYNSTLGGQGCYRDRKKVKVFEEDGNYLGLFEQQEVIEKYNINNKTTLYSICRREQKFLYRNKQRYIFRYEDDDYTEEDICEVKKVHYLQCIKMYNLNGEVVKIFDSINDVYNQLKINKTSILNCCSRKSSFVQYKGNIYIFRYGNDICSSLDINQVLSNSQKGGIKKCVQAIDSVTNEILGVFESYSEGGRILGTRGGKVAEVCNGKRKSSGKYNGHPIFWKQITYEEYLKNKPIHK